jgi:D-aminoacyl-tRNA deacylase
MLAIVVSRADSASVHIGDHLRDLADWREHSDGSRPEGDGGGTVYRLPSDADDSTNGDGPAADPAVELREFADLHLDLVDVADAFGRVDADSDRVQPDLLVFASRHAGETDELLTAHHTGNFGPADYGGEPGAFARACPNAKRRVLAALREHAPPDYEVGMECTHHGPTDVGAPSMFVEVGSAEEQWEDPAAARAVANAILDLQGVAADAPAENGDGAGDGTRRQVVGFGGGHYAPRFERIARETDWAVGHVAADWGLDAMGDPAENRGVVERVFGESTATLAVVEGDRPDLTATIEDLGYRVVSETWLRETTGVPLGLVERVEAALGSVEAGVRFGDTASGAGPATEFTVADLPVDLLTEARGIDADRAWDAVASDAIAFATEQDGTLVGARAALADPADRGKIVESLAAILETSYDSVTVTDEAVVAERSAFDPEKARALGISEGPAFGKLSAGQSVEVGGRTIPPEAVHEERTRRFPY